MSQTKKMEKHPIETFGIDLFSLHPSRCSRKIIPFVSSSRVYVCMIRLENGMESILDHPSTSCLGFGHEHVDCVRLSMSSSYIKLLRWKRIERCNGFMIHKLQSIISLRSFSSKRGSFNVPTMSSVQYGHSEAMISLAWI